MNFLKKINWAFDHVKSSNLSADNFKKVKNMKRQTDPYGKAMKK